MKTTLSTRPWSWIWVGSPSTDINVRLNGEESSQVGDEIDYDDTFGIGDFERFRLDAMWRIKGKHSVRGAYFSDNRLATQNFHATSTSAMKLPVGATVHGALGTGSTAAFL